MNQTPFNKTIVDQKLQELNVTDFDRVSIREIVQLVNMVEAESTDKFIRMEMGVPGLPPSQVGVKAEIEALNNGVASAYPNINGIPEIKSEMARFVKSFMNINVKPECCIPSVGSMQGTYAAFLVSAGCEEGKDTALFIDPGFPVQKQQMMVMGEKFKSFDFYHFRGEKLRAKLISYLEKGNIHSIIYSNPNNPTWACFTEEELQIIGECANQFDVIVMEDLAYFGMDFRKELSKPGEAPYQVSVANYTDNYILFISSSKIFSYAGQRIAMLAMSDKVYHRNYPKLEQRFMINGFGNALIYRALYSLSSGVAHSAQFAMAAMLKAASNGEYNFIKEVKAYGDRASVMKKLFTENGFELVYDQDMGNPLADGFYFTIIYPGMKSGELLKELLYYGISGITLLNTGSTLQGLRACVSFVKPDQFSTLETRLKQFKEDHPIN